MKKKDLIAIRKLCNMSQSEFASATGLPLKSLQSWEQGARKISKIAEFYIREHAKPYIKKSS